MAIVSNTFKNISYTMGEMFRLDISLIRNVFEYSPLKIPTSTAFIYISFYQDGFKLIAENIENNIIEGLNIKSKGHIVEMEQIIEGAQKIAKYIKL